MKWGRSKEMKESFNCITHPHATSCSKLSCLSAGMDGEQCSCRRRFIERLTWFYQFFSHSYKHNVRYVSKIRISHTNTDKTVSSNFKGTWFPKDNRCRRTVQSCGCWCELHTQRQSQALILTRAIFYLWHQNTGQIVKCHLVTLWRS